VGAQLSNVRMASFWQFFRNQYPVMPAAAIPIQDKSDLVSLQ
jgi:hypothetical protein